MWVRWLVGGKTLVSGSAELETARAVGFIAGLDFVLTGLEEQLREGMVGEE